MKKIQLWGPALCALLLVTYCGDGRTGPGQHSGAAHENGEAPTGSRNLSQDAKNSAEYATAYTHFESAHVRPMALSSDGTVLAAVNTTDNRIAVYQPAGTNLNLVTEVPVGMEPVAVALRTRGDGKHEAWVVNHLSDSISIVELDPNNFSTARVIRTLWVGDEPRDIVFGGVAKSRAFITAARRGQNHPNNPELTTPGVGRADVWVFDTANPGGPGNTPGGSPLTIIRLFGDTPRALAVSPDGLSVYAAVFTSGSRTTTLPVTVVEKHGGLPPAPAGATPGAPSVGLIVKYENGAWVDETGRDWSAQVPFSLPDKDVFKIDASQNIPVQAAAAGEVSGVGTVLFNMAVHPSNGKLYVSNTEAVNEMRFENVLNGRFSQSRISIIHGTNVDARHLNGHIDYSVPTGPASEIAQSIAQPTQIVFSSSGETMYVAGFGSNKIGIYNTTAFENGTAQPQLVEVGAGPTGIVDAGAGMVYVMNQLENTISVLIEDGGGNTVESHRLALPFDAAPPTVRAGQEFLYNAANTSGHGDVSCASCHVFGDTDHLAWDLGNPEGEVLPNPNIRINPANVDPLPYHPMKGPMTTQSLRGMQDAGPMHWRGDKTGGLNADGTLNPDGDPLDETAAFLQFNGAFTGLQGRAEQLPEEAMLKFAEFILQVQYPPNPIHALDNTDTAAEARGRDRFMNSPDFGGTNTCNSCHALPVTTNGGLALAGLDPGFTQDMKIPHLRNLYTKVGMFGLDNDVYPVYPQFIVGDQIRGFGFQHDGSLSTVFFFLQNLTFNFGPVRQLLPNPFSTPKQEAVKRDIEQFLLGMDTGLRPIVGQQLTLNPDNYENSEAGARLDLLIARTIAGDCDLTVKGRWSGENRGAVYGLNGDVFTTDRAGESTLTPDQLILFASLPGQSVTFTAVPPGNGLRIGIDRDLDGVLDGDE